MQTIIAAVTMIGAITMYSSEAYGGQPLYCGGVYNEDTSFVALPLYLFENGAVECGDVVRVKIGDRAFWSQALDTGPFGRYRVEQWGNAPIVADVPEHMWAADGISAPGKVFNLSAFNRMASDCKMGRLQ